MNAAIENEKKVTDFEVPYRLYKAISTFLACFFEKENVKGCQELTKKLSGKTTQRIRVASLLPTLDMPSISRVNYENS